MDKNKLDVKLFVTYMIATINEEASKNPLQPNFDEIMELSENNKSIIDFALNKLNQKDSK